MRTARLVLKLHRFDVVVLGVALLVLALTMLSAATRLTALPGEIAACGDPVRCNALQDEGGRLTGLAFQLSLLGIVLPVFAGLILGVPVVAREVERATASLPWTMSRTRHGWFLRRIAILGGALLAITVLPAVAIEVLTASTAPGVDLARSFISPDARAPLVAARALTAFAVAALAGALFGRALPGLLLAIAAAVALLIGLQFLDDIWLRSEAVPLAEDPISFDRMDSLVIEYGYQLPDGRVVDWQTAYETIDDPNVGPDGLYPPRYLGIPAALASEKRARETAMILVAGLAAIGAATVVVDRRRPY
jgi:hypothetical protein